MKHQHLSIIFRNGCAKVYIGDLTCLDVTTVAVLSPVLEAGDHGGQQL